MIKCPKDNSRLTCISTRGREAYTARRYQCLECGLRLSTIEQVVEDVSKGKRLSRAKQDIVPVIRGLLEQIEALL